MPPLRCLTAVVCGLALLVPSGGHAQSNPPGTRIDLASLGPQVGERLPDFSLPDQHGQSHSLKSLLEANGAIIVFFRSADW